MVSIMLVTIVVLCIVIAVLALVGPAIWTEIRDLIHDFHWFGW